MKLVRCNKCKYEYYIVETPDYKGYIISQPQCQQCRATDFTVLEDDVYVAYKDIKDDMDTQQEDIKHSLAFFKEELLELIETYIEPFLK